MLEAEEEHPVHLLHREVTEKIIGAAFEVHQTLGYGFLERVYQRALQVELLRRGATAEIEKRIQVLYKGVVEGDYAADLIVDGCVVVEIKVAPDYDKRDEAQLLNELKGDRTKTWPALELRQNESRSQAIDLLNPCFIRVHPWLNEPFPRPSHRGRSRAALCHPHGNGSRRR